MSIRNLDHLFEPDSVAVFGASSRPGSVGATVLRNLRNGAYSGPVYAVNPKHREIDGLPCFASAASLPGVPGLAVICTPPATVPGLIEDIGARGTRAAVVLTAGLDRAAVQAMLAAAKPRLLRILGPNCIGLMSPKLGLNASFAHTEALPGELAFVTQSGALLTAVLDWAKTRGIGFSRLVSLGERADVDLGDVLDVLASDPATKSILLYVESVESPRKFMSAARAAARNKPVIVVKAGRAGQGVHAAASHTGALAGSDIVIDSAIRRAGMLRVDTLAELFMAAETLANFRANRSSSLAVLTNGGGAGVMAADAAALMGVPLCTLDAATLKTLDTLLPKNWPRANPVDIIGDAPIERYTGALQAMLADPQAPAILFMHAPTAIVNSADIARACAPIAQATPNRVMGCWLGDESVADARQVFHAAGLPGYATPEEAVRAFAMLTTYRRNQALLLEAPGPALAVPAGAAAAGSTLIAQVLAQGRSLLTEPEAKALMQAYGIPVVATQSVGPDADEAVAAAKAMGYPVALKILSNDITHKSDVGGVALALADSRQLRHAVAAMLKRVHAARPDATIQGFTVQAMAPPSAAPELIVGASVDSVFGPVILFGQGGTAVEVLADRAVALPPLNRPLARELVSRTRVAKLLAGYRDQPPADVDALYDVLIAVSQMLADQEHIAELDINPLRVSAQGALALDARVKLGAKACAGESAFAIRPYPAHLEEALQWNGGTIRLRPIRPEDEAQHLAFLESLDPEDIRMRIFYSRRSIERTELARLTQIDYEREMVFIAEADDPGSEDGATAADGPVGAQHQQRIQRIQRTLGTVRAVADPDNRDAEFGIIVRSDLKGRGLGHVLMQKLIRHARDRGTQRLVATVLRENQRMLALARDCGFTVEAAPRDGEGDTRHVWLQLR